MNGHLELGVIHESGTTRAGLGDEKKENNTTNEHRDCLLFYFNSRSGDNSLSNKGGTFFFYFFLTPSGLTGRRPFFFRCLPLSFLSFFSFFFSSAPTLQTHHSHHHQWPRTQQGHNRRTPRPQSGHPRRLPPPSLPDSSRPLVSRNSSAMTEVLFIILFFFLFFSSSFGYASTSFEVHHLPGACYFYVLSFSSTYTGYMDWTYLSPHTLTLWK